MIIDDEPFILNVFELALKNEGIDHVLTLKDSRDVMPTVREKDIGVMLLDLSMPHISGEEILKKMSREFPQIPVIIVTGNQHIKSAVRCMKSGAYDYLLKPAEEGVLEACVKKAIRFREQEIEIENLKNRLLTGDLEHPELFLDVVSRNDQMHRIFAYIEAVAMTRNPILITGETGVGKGLIIRAIHEISGRSGPLIPVDVSGLDDNVFSDTLFGHHKGAFTGAMEPRRGMVEQAQGGTIFLDEIGELPPASQLKLLRLLEEREFLPLGSEIHKHTDARVVAATNVDLTEETARGNFRKDLYYRLRTHHIHIPPLRDRMDDLPLLVDHFVQQAAKECGKKKPAVPPALFDLLGTHSFPGNIRELKALIYNAVTVHKGGILSTETFRADLGIPLLSATGSAIETLGIRDNPFKDRSYLPTLKQADYLLTKEALERSNHNQSVAAQLLGISKQAMGKRIKRMKLA